MLKTGEFKMSESNGIVFYTDGGCKPNPGRVGWGCHGYMYSTLLDKQGSGLSSHIITSKGYVLSNTISKETEVPVKPTEYYDFFGSSETEGTNNVAEIDAVFYSLNHVKDRDVNEIAIYTDSDYVKRGLTEWVENWIKNDWKRKDGGDVQSRIGWERLLGVITHIKSRDIKITINWVKGHSDNFGNIIADRLASLGVMYSISYVKRQEFKTSDAKGYWKSEVTRNPLLGLKRLYFNPTVEKQGVNTYYLADPVKDDLFGRRLSESVYAIVRLNESEPIIDRIKQKQYNISGDINSVIMMRLDRVYNTVIYDMVLEYGDYALVPNKNKGSLGLDFLDKREVTKELYPTGLPLRAIENYSYLEEILDCYTQYIKVGEITSAYFKKKGIKFTDITNVFYETVEITKKKEVIQQKSLKKEFGVGFKGIKVTIDHNGKSVPIDLLLGLDILERNSLKHIETEHPKLFLVTWGDENKLSYCTITDTDIGYAIWYNYYASQIFIVK